MNFENGLFTHANGKIASMVGFGLMAGGALGNTGLAFLGWRGSFLDVLCALAVFGGMILAAGGAFLMYNEGRDMNDIILCGTLGVGIILFWRPSPHVIVTFLFNVLILSYLAAFAFAAFKREDNKFALLFAGLLVFSAIIAPIFNILFESWYYESYGNGFVGLIRSCFGTFSNVVGIAAPALALLETTKKNLNEEAEAEEVTAKPVARAEVTIKVDKE